MPPANAEEPVLPFVSPRPPIPLDPLVVEGRWTPVRTQQNLGSIASPFVPMQKQLRSERSILRRKWP